MKVWGHPRSGNHFLASIILRAFYRDTNRFHLRVPSAATGHWSRRQAGAVESFGAAAGEDASVPWGRLLGSHVLTPPATVEKAIYVYRDGRDVALSVYRWDRFRAVEEQGLSLSEYLPIDWVGSPGFPWTRDVLLWEHWRRHVEAWLAREDVLAVRYEDLIEDLDGQLQRIEDWSGLPRVPVDNDVAVGWNASKSRHRLARWRGQMSDGDLALYDEFIPRDFAGRWDH
jgi:hypothetical protein